MKFREVVVAPLVRKAQLLRQVRSLEKENESLRQRLAAAQSAKLVSDEQAVKLRSEKERLRARIASMKKATAQSDRVLEQLREKLESALERIAKLEG